MNIINRQMSLLNLRFSYKTIIIIYHVYHS